MKQIITLGELANFISSEEVQKQIGTSPEDKVEVKISNRTMTVRSVDETELNNRMDLAMAALMDRRSKLFEKLAEGAK